MQVVCLRWQAQWLYYKFAGLHCTEHKIGAAGIEGCHYAVVVSVFAHFVSIFCVYSLIISMVVVSQSNTEYHPCGSWGGSHR